MKNERLLLTIMRVLCYQLLLVIVFTSFGFAHEGRTQSVLDKKISLTEGKIELVELLNKIEKQYKVGFVYSSAIVPAKKQVSVNARNIPLSALLTEVLSPLHLGFFASGEMVVITKKTEEPAISNDITNQNAALQVTITGRIVREGTNEPLGGVNVQEKGSTTGTVTDDNGNFSLVIADPNAILVISHTGFETREVAVNGAARVNVTLVANATNLDDVIVVGYGSQSRRNVTGSVSKVEMAKYENLPNTNVTQALRGTVAGVQFTENARPGQGGSILIRGQRSISAGNNPLIVLDGIFFNGSLNDINPNDIESMEVLKDASAGAIYGSRAANGVILISSKRGKSKTPQIRFNMFNGVSGWSSRMKLLTPERYIEKTLDYQWQFTRGERPDISRINEFLTPPERENYAAGNTVDPWDVVAQTGRIQSYDLSVSGNANGTNYFISGNFSPERGIIYNDNVDKVSLRANLETKVADWFSIGLNAQYTNRDFSGIEGSVREAYWLSPYAKLYYDDGDPVPFPVDDQLVGHPVRSAKLNGNEEGSQNLFSNIYAKIDVPFIQGLSYRINYSPNMRWERNYNFSPIYQRNGVNALGSASKEERRNFDWVMENIVTYNKSIGVDHDFDVTALYGRNSNSYNRTYAAGSDFTAFTDVNGWNKIDVAKVYTVQTAATQVEGVSAMLRLNYRFKNKYLLTLTARRDGSSVFSQNNKFATMPSAAIAWIASDEKFLESSPFSLLKFRLSHGAVGNQAIGPYQTLLRGGTLQYVFGDGSSTYTGGFVSGIGNSNLKWETTYSTNLAVDFELFKGRLGGTVEVYNMDTKDLLLSKVLPSPMGFNTILDNIGEVNNKGLEFTLNTVNVHSGKFEWSSNIVFSTNRNRIVHLTREDADKDGVEDDNLTNRWFIGQPIRVAFDYVMDGIYQVGDTDIPTGQRPGWHRFKDISGNGTIGPEDRVIQGQYEPKVRWGVTNMFRYGNLSLSVFVNAMQGWIQQFNVLAVNSSGGSNNFPGRPANILDAGWWTENNQSNTRPSLDYVNSLGHNYYVSRDFVRIQDVSLAYQVPVNWLSRFKITNLRLFVSGKNLVLFSSFPGFDPETGYSSNAASGAWPTQRSLVGGLNLSF